MSNLLSTFFGPLDKSACLYFLLLSILAFITLIIIIIFATVTLIKNPNKFDYKMIINGVLAFINIFLVYFVNRLMYTMCIKSLV